jgi:wobble nucleotide-excising tRNase
MDRKYRATTAKAIVSGSEEDVFHFSQQHGICTHNAWFYRDIQDELRRIKILSVLQDFP